MAWRVARSLDTLLAQINAAYPTRSKLSDGSIGNAAHATRSSDHNPWFGPGIVTARDITHDPDGGVDCEALYQALVASRDPRIKYLIWQRTITSGSSGPSPWVRRKYAGANAHTKHLHISVVASARCDVADLWSLGGFGKGAAPVPLVPVAVPAPAPAAPAGARLLRLADPRFQGDDVRVWQGELWRIGVGVGAHDSVYGPAVELGTKDLQRAAAIDIDGIVGPGTRGVASRVRTYPKPDGGTSYLCEPGGRAETIRAFQERLRERGRKIAVDGKMKAGGETQRAIRAFQAEQGLSTDGIGGVTTWIALWTRGA